MDREDVVRGAAIMAGTAEGDRLEKSAASMKPREKATEAWQRQLNDGRVEIMCKAPQYRVRVSAPEEQAWEVVELFEKWTGLEINADRRPRRAPRQIAGQLSMVELESEG